MLALEAALLLLAMSAIWKLLARSLTNTYRLSFQTGVGLPAASLRGPTRTCIPTQSSGSVLADFKAAETQQRPVSLHLLLQQTSLNGNS